MQLMITALTAHATFMALGILLVRCIWRLSPDNDIVRVGSVTIGGRLVEVH